MSFWRTSARADDLDIDLEQIRNLSDSSEDEYRNDVKEKLDKMVKGGAIGPLNSKKQKTKKIEAPK